MRDTLTRLGHDVVSASDMAPGTADEEILALAANAADREAAADQLAEHGEVRLDAHQRLGSARG